MDEDGTREWLIERQPSYRELYLEHLELEARLRELQALPYPDHHQQAEITGLKRSKLKVKDAMQVLVDRHRYRWCSRQEPGNRKGEL